MTKYGNRLTEVDGIVFHSAKEAARYGELVLAQKAGEIRDLQLQVSFPLKTTRRREFGTVFLVDYHTVAHYIADFVYTDEHTGQRVVEDTKSPATRKNRVYALKKKWLKLQEGIEIVET